MIFHTLSRTPNGGGTPIFEKYISIPSNTNDGVKVKLIKMIETPSPKPNNISTPIHEKSPTVNEQPLPEALINVRCFSVFKYFIIN